MGQLYGCTAANGVWVVPGSHKLGKIDIKQWVAEAGTERLPEAVPMFFLGALATGFVVMVRAITADVGDELRLEGGRDLIGLLYAVTSATTKAAGALAIFVTFWLLKVQGYNPRPHAVNGADQIHGLELTFIIGPIAFVMLGGAAFIGYKLSAEKHAAIRRPYLRSPVPTPEATTRNRRAPSRRS